MGFLNYPLIRQDNDTGEYVLQENLLYRCVRLNMDFITPKGSRSDFASVPWLAEVILPKQGKHDRASFQHDACYRKGLFLKVYSYPEDNTQLRFKPKYSEDKYMLVPVRDILSRKKADILFRDALIDCGINRIRAYLAYWGLRIGGFSNFQKE